MRSTITLSKRTAVFAAVLSLLLLPATPVLCQLGFAVGLCGVGDMDAPVESEAPPCHAMEHPDAASPGAPGRASVKGSGATVPDCCTLLSMPTAEVPAEALLPVAALCVAELLAETNEPLTTFSSRPRAVPWAGAEPVPPPLFKLYRSLLL